MVVVVSESGLAAEAWEDQDDDSEASRLQDKEWLLLEVNNESREHLGDAIRVTRNLPYVV